MARDLGFRRDNHIEKQVRVAVDEPGQKSRATQINGFGAGRYMRLHLRRRSYFLDLAPFDQHPRGRKHAARPWIEQPACPHECRLFWRLRRKVAREWDEQHQQEDDSCWFHLFNTSFSTTYCGYLTTQYVFQCN